MGANRGCELRQWSVRCKVELKRMQEGEKVKKLADQPYKRAGHVEVIGYENLLKIFLLEGGVEPAASFGWRSTR